METTSKSTNKRIDDWARHADFEDMKRRQINSRDVYIWGAFAHARQLKKTLADNGINIVAYIDSFQQGSEYDGLPLYRFDKGISSKSVFIIVAVNGLRRDIVESLHGAGFQANTDYVYLSEQLPHAVISWFHGEYRDRYGNCISVDSGDCAIEIELIGYDNEVHIGNGVRSGVGCCILAENGAEITIGSDASLGSNVSIEARDGKGSVAIGKSCSLGDGARVCSYGGTIALGEKCSLGRRALLLCGTTSNVLIGDDCMFSSDVAVLGSDTHSIFDMDSGACLSDREIGVSIGRHVWLGKSAIVLYNSELSDGCIVGANSLVKTSAGANCVLAGNPAKIVSTNRIWDRRRAVVFEEI